MIKGDEFLSGQSSIVIIRIDKCCDEQGFTYKKNGWHYLCETMKQYTKNPRITYRRSILFYYYKKYQPVSFFDSIFYNGPKSQRKIEDKWYQLPWVEGMPSYIDLKNEDHQHFGPNSDRFGEKELRRIISVYEMIKLNGYLPKKYKDGYIRGYFLQKNNDYRFLITGGQHRIAALAVLEQKKIPVKIEPLRKRFINVKEVNEWPQVMNGFHEKDMAIEIFNSYFRNDGREKAKKMGLLQ
ncbi:hypothetical protein [Oceanobacillus profundus]|uniref:hypothetical protein n=1 Tax=Oceanobacillus profundus TaxID=372463 RepID=UPI003636B552